MPIYYPAMACQLTIPDTATTRAGAAANAGQSAITVDVRVKKATWTVNNHNEADILSLSVEYADLAVDPRLLKHAFIRFWMDDVPPGESLLTLPGLERFVGIVKRVHRQAHEGSAEITIEAHDQTTLFLASKPYPDRGMPTFDMSLRQAWELICDHTGYPDPNSNNGAYVSSVKALRDRLVFKPASLESESKLSSLISGRLAKLGKPQIARGESTNSWDVFVTLCSNLGLICYIDGDQCVVTTILEFYTPDRAPTFIYGTNITDLDEHVSSEISGNGIGLRSYDPETGRVIEAVYPPEGDPRIFRKRSTAKSKKADPHEVLAEKYDWFNYFSVTDPDTLLKVAIGAYEERSRQEIEGELKTAEMAVNGVSLLDLRPGENIAVHVDPQANVASKIPNEEDRKAYLMSIGYSPNVAALVARNADAIQLLNANPMHLKTITVELSDSDFGISIHYNNVIRVDESVAGLK